MKREYIEFNIGIINYYDMRKLDINKKEDRSESIFSLLIKQRFLLIMI